MDKLKVQFILQYSPSPLGSIQPKEKLWRPQNHVDKSFQQS